MNQLKVLVIDDDSTTCDLLETILQMENYQTASANDISKLGIISLLEQERPQLLILDLNLGSQETLEYVTEIKQDGNWQDLVILMTSAIDRRQECLAVGATDFILKPFSWQHITHLVNQLVTHAN
jgi:DNA-binding response OmpR family regulator